MINKNILIVDDEKITRNGLRDFFSNTYDVFVAANIEEGKYIFEDQKIDALLCDLRLGNENGLDLINYALKLPSAPICILMTAYGSVDIAVEAMKNGVYHFISKPINLDELDLILKRALNNRRLEKENIELQSKISEKNALEKLIGTSEAMKRLQELIKQVANTRATILIEGESGTGKELVANAIHELSNRKNKKITIVHCAALSPQLLESELFGHEKGAFTGALNQRIGRFEQADGGTLVLDEIGEIDSSTQVKLLRALGERSIERVGSNKTIKVDVRLITATNKKLDELVSEGNFREDLYFRLNVVKIIMPTLAERKEDIILLSSVFLKEFSKENKKKVKNVSPEVYKLLENYDWPGNIRELRTVIERGVVLTNSDVIEKDHIPENIVNYKKKLKSADHKSNGVNEKSKDKFDEKNNLYDLDYDKEAVDPENIDFSIQNMELKLIKKALKFTKGKRAKAAKLLGISRRTLQRKLNDIDIL